MSLRESLFQFDFFPCEKAVSISFARNGSSALRRQWRPTVTHFMMCSIYKVPVCLTWLRSSKSHQAFYIPGLRLPTEIVHVAME